HRWIRNGERAKIELLTRYHADEFVAHVLRGLRDIEPDLLRGVLENRPSLGPIVARAKELSVEARQALKDWAFTDLQLAEARAASLPEGTSSWRRGNLAYGALALHELALNGTRGKGSVWTERTAEAL